MHILICLRDLKVEKSILEVSRDVDYNAPPDPALAEDEREPEEIALEEFVEKARSLLPLKQSAVDVYIGWFGDQGDFFIPKSFFELIAETGWPVTFDINS